MKKFIYLNPQESMPSAQGAISWQSSVRACSRCHACSQSCPSYRLQPEEIFSPRGRVQLIRLFLEGKITSYRHVPLLENSIRSCLLCARCNAICAGQVPVAHQMVALRQAHQVSFLPSALQLLLLIRRRCPSLFHFILRFALTLHRTRLSFVLYPIFPDWLKHLYKITPFKTIPLRNVHQPDPTGKQPDLLYLPSLYTQYIDGTAGEKILQLSQAKNPLVLGNISSGLEYYIYQNRAVCLQVAKKLLTLWEKYSSKKPLLLLTDSLEIYSFIQNYPFLFHALPNWKKRAEKLAAYVRFVTDLSFPKTEIPVHLDKPVYLDTSTILYPAPTIIQQARKILKTFCGKNLVECEYTGFSLPVAGVSLVKDSQAKKFSAQYAQNLTQHSIAKIYCLSGWATLELQAALKTKKSAATAEYFIHTVTDYGTVQK